MTDSAKFLQSLLVERRAKNSSYSARALARDLNLSAAFISQVLSGKRNLSLEQKVKIRSLLGLRSAQPGLEIIEQTLEHEKILRYWYHFAILEMCQIQKLMNSASDIAKRLGLSELEIELAIERLIHFGYIKVESRRLVRTKNPFVLNSARTSPALREFHQSRLNAAHDELKVFDQDRVERRCFQTLFLPSSAQKVKQASAMVDKFQDRLIAFLKEGQADEVYQFSLQLFSVEKGIAK